jgi:hypothetical protein
LAAPQASGQQELLAICRSSDAAKRLPWDMLKAGQDGSWGRGRAVVRKVDNRCLWHTKDTVPICALEEGSHYRELWEGFMQ